jgi:hypothetical protein
MPFVSTGIRVEYDDTVIEISIGYVDFVCFQIDFRTAPDYRRRGSEISHGRRDASRGTAEMRNDLCANSSTVMFLHHVRSFQVRSYRRCELDSDRRDR